MTSERGFQASPRNRMVSNNSLPVYYPGIALFFYPEGIRTVEKVILPGSGWMRDHFVFTGL